MKAKECVNKACDSCKYFSLRYYRANYNYCVAFGEGNCGIKKFTKEERAKLPYGFVCEKWAQKPCADTDLFLIKNELMEVTAKLIAIIKELPK